MKRFALALLLLAGCSRPAPPEAPPTPDDVAAAHVEKLGGSVVRDGTRPGRPVVDVTLTAENKRDEDVRVIAGCEHLRSLRMPGLQLTDTAIVDLAKCKELEVLILGRTQVTDGGLRVLAGLRKLKKLDLRDSWRATGWDDLQKALPDCVILR